MVLWMIDWYCLSRDANYPVCMFVEDAVSASSCSCLSSFCSSSFLFNYLVLSFMTSVMLVVFLLGEVTNVPPLAGNFSRGFFRLIQVCTMQCGGQRDMERLNWWEYCDGTLKGSKCHFCTCTIFSITPMSKQNILEEWRSKFEGTCSHVTKFYIGSGFRTLHMWK